MYHHSRLDLKDSSRLTFHTSRKCAFTLAELLITLGIIGVVAALTIPTLIAKYQHFVLKSQFKKSYANLQNAINLVNAENGTAYDCFRVGYGELNVAQCRQFWDNLLKKMVVIKEENFRDGLYLTRDEVIANGGDASRGCSYMDAGHSYRYTYSLIDGSHIIINRIYYGNDAHNVLFAFDINGQKGPNRWGYDLFYLMINKSDKNSPIITLSDEFCKIREKGGYYFSEMIQK